MRIKLIALILICCWSGINLCQNDLSLHNKNKTSEFGLNKHLKQNINKILFHHTLKYKNHITELKFYKPVSVDTSDECNLTLTNGTLVKDAYLIEGNDSIFTFVKSGIGKNLPVSNIHKIVFEKHNFWTGVLVGALGSVCFWEILSIVHSNDVKNSLIWGIWLGILCAPPAGLICGLVAEFGSKDEIYNFSTINPSSRALRLKKIITDHKF